MSGFAGNGGRLMLWKGGVRSTWDGQPAQSPHAAVADPRRLVAQHCLAARGGEM